MHDRCDSHGPSRESLPAGDEEPGLLDRAAERTGAGQMLTGEDYVEAVRETRAPGPWTAATARYGPAERPAR